jgi:hypothetical protein
VRGLMDRDRSSTRVLATVVAVAMLLAATAGAIGLVLGQL